MSSVYSNKEIKNIELNKLKQFFKPLVVDVKIEESEAVKYIKENELKYDFKHSMSIFSKTQCYKTFSIYGIMKNFNKDTKYKTLELSYLLEVWFNSSTLISKDEIVNCDILIIHTDGMKWQSETKTNALLELINSRRLLNHITWLFIDSCDVDTFDNNYPGIIKLLRRKYISKV